MKKDEWIEKINRHEQKLEKISEALDPDNIEDCRKMLELLLATFKEILEDSYKVKEWS